MLQGPIKITNVTNDTMQIKFITHNITNNISVLIKLKVMTDNKLKLGRLGN